MALSTPVSKAAVVTATSGTTVTTGSFTPTANALIIVAVSYGEAVTGDSTRTISDTLGGLTWTETGVYASTKGGYTGIFTAKAPASPVAGTVKCTFSLAITRALIRPFEITGQHATVPLGVTGTNQFSGAGTSLAVTLSGTPAATSTVFAAIGGKHAGTTVTEDAAYTQLSTDNIGTGPVGLLDTSYDAASAASSFTWTGITSGTNNAVCGAAVEIVAAASGATNNVTVSATCTTAATAVRAVGRPVSASVPTTTVVARRVGKTIGATAATTAKIIRQIPRTAAATVTTSATAVASKAKNITVACTVTTTAVFSRAVGHTMTATVATSSTVARQVRHTVSVSVATTAKVVRQIPRTASVTVATTSKVIRRVGKTLSAAVTTVVALVATPTITSKTFTPPTRYYVPSVTPFTPNLERTPAAYFKHTNIPKPSNVFKMLDGTYTEDQIGTDFWANVAIAYLGGHGPYVVTAAEAAALTAAGYGGSIS